MRLTPRPPIFETISNISCLYRPPRSYLTTPTPPPQSCSECPWLAFHSLCAEQTFEEEQGIWNALLKQLRKDNKISIDTALKVYWLHMCVCIEFGPGSYVVTYNNSFIFYALLWLTSMSGTSAWKMLHSVNFSCLKQLISSTAYR